MRQIGIGCRKEQKKKKKFSQALNIFCNFIYVNPIERKRRKIKL